jgi:hypothetical protein
VNNKSNAHKTHRLLCDDDDDDDGDVDAFTRIVGILLRWLVEVNPWPSLKVTVGNEYA